MTALFISDLHLHASHRAATDCFLRFLDDTARFARELYILGDLFEAWTGDDAPGPLELEVIAALRRLTATGITCGLLRGNRDFLISGRFAADTGVSLLADETVIDLDGQQTLLMHGDTLCTDDHAYQRYRRVVHHPLTQSLFLAMPVGMRTRIAAYARRQSAAANAGKPSSIMDVNQDAVAAAMRRHGVDLLIHGHTHRPAVHQLELDGHPARRIVLGAWYEQGSVLRWTASGPDLRIIVFD